MVTKTAAGSHQTYTGILPEPSRRRGRPNGISCSPLQNGPVPFLSLTRRFSLRPTPTLPAGSRGYLLSSRGHSSRTPFLFWRLRNCEGFGHNAETPRP